MKKVLMAAVALICMTMVSMVFSSCGSDDDTTKTMVFDTELEVTQQDLIQYEVIFGDVEDQQLIWLFKDFSKAAQVMHAKNNPRGARYVIFKSWSLSNGKLTLTAEKNGEKESWEYSVKKMYKKLDAGRYEIRIIARDETDTYVFNAVDDHSNHALAEEWWNLISE